MARSTDPRHGIWILPLVIVAMVGGTAVFVNSLSPGSVPGGSTVSTEPSETTTTLVTAGTSTSTTTTLPPEIAAYITEIDALGVSANELVSRATEINTQWDDRAVSFQATLENLRALSSDTDAFVLEVEATSPVNLPQLEPAHLDATLLARAMSSAGVGMVEGLQDPNSAEGRRTALAEYQNSGTEFQNSLEVIRGVARGDQGGAPASDVVPAETTVPADGSETGETSLEGDVVEGGDDEAFPDE